MPLIDAGLDPFRAEQSTEPAVSMDLSVGQHYEYVDVDARSIATQRRERGYVHTEVTRPIRLTADLQEATVPASYDRTDNSPIILKLLSQDLGDRTAWAVAHSLRQIIPSDFDFTFSVDASSELVETERRWQQLIHQQTPGFQALWTRQRSHERIDGLRGAWSAARRYIARGLGSGAITGALVAMPYDRFTTPAAAVAGGVAGGWLLSAGSRARTAYRQSIEQSRVWECSGPLVQDAHNAGTRYRESVALIPDGQAANDDLLVRLRIR